MQVAKNKVVSIDYTLTSPEGEILDTSKGADPLTYLHGVNFLISGLERALEGKSTGDAFKAVVPPDQGYGEHDAELVETLPRSVFGGMQGRDIRVGMAFQGRTEAGLREVKVVAVDADTVTIDANHALAGKTLHFSVNVVDVRDATAEEISHGHVHGPDGHHH